MGKAMNLEALGSAVLHTDPCHWAKYDTVFYDHVLDAPFPEDHFQEHSQRRLLRALRKEDSEAWHQHNVDTRALLELGESEVHAPGGLHEAWLEVATDLLSPEYKDCISDVAQHDVRGLEFQAHFWRFHEGSFFTPHVDKAHKVVTHLMYLSDDWVPEMGGVLRIHGSPDPADAEVSVPPRKNTGAILVRTENAWHSVSRIPLGTAWSRKVLQVWFWGS